MELFSRLNTPDQASLYETSQPSDFVEMVGLNTEVIAPSAVNKVFNLPELVEEIATHLEPKDLVRFQKTSCTCGEIVRGCKALKTKLFLQAIPVHEFFSFDKVPTVRKSPAGRLGEYPVAKINPLLGKTKAQSRGLQHQLNLSMHFSMHFDIPLRLFRTCGTYWEQMFLTQPPAREITVQYQFARSARGTPGLLSETTNPDIIHSIDITKPQGVRIIDVVEHLDRVNMHKYAVRRDANGERVVTILIHNMVPDHDVFLATARWLQAAKAARNKMETVTQGH